MFEVDDVVVYINRDLAGKEMVRSEAVVLEVVETDDTGVWYRLDLDKENLPILIHEDNLEATS